MWTKIAAVVNNPRPFVRAKSYFGPDRRRQDLEFKGVDRRNSVMDGDGDGKIDTGEAATDAGAGAAA